MTDSTSSLTGKVLGGKYKLVERIGEGSYAVVFRAWQGSLQRYVAVKVLLPRVVMDDSMYHEFVTRFKREAAIIAQFQHDHIVPIFDYGEHDGRAYLVMPYLPGGNLQDMLTRRGKLSLHEALPYIEQAASALDYAHRLNVVHRDLKPGNFLLHTDGRLVLADFGIAHLTQDTSGAKLTKTDISLGTPAYMAPEVIRSDMLHGKEVDGRADIYGLGILLFEMLSGDVPFKEENTYAVLIKHLSEPLPSLHRIDPTIPPTVDLVLRKATAKRREDRYASAGEFAQAFRTAINPTYPFANMPHSSGVDQRSVPTILPSTIPLPSYTAPASHAAGAPTIADTVEHELPPLPQTIHAVQQPQRKSIRILPFGIILSLVLIVLAGGVWLGSGRLPTQPQGVSCQELFPSPMFTAATLTPEQAQSLVRQYYCYWMTGDYHAAYNLLGADYQNQHPWQDPDGPPDFSYRNTTSAKITYNNIDVRPNGTFYVWLINHATETVGTSTYAGYFVVGKDRDGTWKLLEPHLARTGS